MTNIPYTWSREKEKGEEERGEEGRGEGGKRIQERQGSKRKM